MWPPHPDLFWDLRLLPLQGVTMALGPWGSGNCQQRGFLSEEFCCMMRNMIVWQKIAQLYLCQLLTGGSPMAVSFKTHICIACRSFFFKEESFLRHLVLFSVCRVVSHAEVMTWICLDVKLDFNQRRIVKKEPSWCYYNVSFGPCKSGGTPREVMWPFLRTFWVTVVVLLPLFTLYCENLCSYCFLFTYRSTAPCWLEWSLSSGCWL